MTETIGRSKYGNWVHVCAVDELPDRGGRAVRHGLTEIALFRLTHGAVVAVENQCPHKGGKLSEGIVCDHTVICPLHNWRIDLLRGEATDPDRGCVRTFPVELRDGAVYVDFSATNAPLRLPLVECVGRHPDNGRPRLGRRRAGIDDFSIHDFDRKIPVLAVEPPSPTDEITHRVRILGARGDCGTYSIADLCERFTVIDTPAHIVCLMFGFTRPVRWTGIRLSDLIATLDESFEFASFYSWDTTQTREGERFFETLPRAYVEDPRTLLAFGMNGRPLPREHGGPLRLVAPFLQGYKSVKWLTDIRLTECDEIGYKKKHGFIEFPELHAPTRQ